MHSVSIPLSLSVGEGHEGVDLREELAEGGLEMKCAGGTLPEHTYLDYAGVPPNLPVDNARLSILVNFHNGASVTGFEEHGFCCDEQSESRRWLRW
jgi:hypothetical protein